MGNKIATMHGILRNMTGNLNRYQDRVLTVIDHAQWTVNNDAYTLKTETLIIFAIHEDRAYKLAKVIIWSGFGLSSTGLVILVDTWVHWCAMRTTSYFDQVENRSPHRFESHMFSLLLICGPPYVAFRPLDIAIFFCFRMEGGDKTDLTLNWTNLRMMYIHAIYFCCLVLILRWHREVILFLSLDLLSEYRIQHGAIGPPYVISSYSTWIFCRAVSGFATDCPCDVWCRGLTICLLHVGPSFGNRFLNTSRAVGLTYGIVYLHFLYFDICNYTCLDTSYHFMALSLLLKYSLFFQVLLYWHLP